MTDYEFCIRLRVTHPSMDPAQITAELRINPSRAWRAGDKRETPKGTPLDGVNDESYWTARLHEEKRISSTSQGLEDFLHESNARLAPHAGFLREIVSTGGYVEYFIGWFGGRNIGASLSPELMQETSALNVAIGLDVYAEQGETHNKRSQPMPLRGPAAG